MDIPTIATSYLLAGFFVYWLAQQCEKRNVSVDQWGWELGATLLWPVTIICGVIMSAIDHWRARRHS